ncbi:MAG TPA: hypothetical protein VFF65_02270 [Phycisphaerales bacterium]|nr:hypothetical protein [Phycisphaerales bacterium]
MEILPAGTHCEDAQAWALAYIDAVVKASERSSAASAALARGAAAAAVEARRNERRCTSASR